jgi:5'-nucleotidase
MAIKTKNASKKKSGFLILVSNDDGVKSPGIRALSEALTSLGTVVVVAPEREQSTMGHALTLHKPVRLFDMGVKNGVDRWALSGTPADCVYMGIRHVLGGRKPDLIVSGINKGVNLGNDLYFSGTVAAAREGAVMNIPAMACSLDYRYEPGEEAQQHFESAAKYCAKLAKEILENGLPNNCLLNVNFPPRFDQVKGVKVTRQGFLKYSDTIIKRKDFRGKPYYWLGGKLKGFSKIEGSDANVVNQGYVSITPVRIDITQYEFMETLRTWDLDHKKLTLGRRKTKATKKKA